MKCRPFKHLADRILLQTLAGMVKNDQVSTARLLACIAEVYERKLYRQAGYSTMYLFLVHEFHMSEDVAFKRIRAAKAGLRFPTIFDAIADGRLHVSAVVMLSPHLTSDNAAELLAAAEHRTKAEIEVLLAERFPRPDLPTLVQAIVSAVSGDAPAVRIVEVATQGLAPSEFRQLAPGPVATNIDSAAQRVLTSLPSRATLAPLSPERFALQVTVSQAVHDKLRYAQELLGHTVPSGDLEAVLERAVDALIGKLERQKFANCVRTRPHRGAPKGRYVPAEVRRTVWQRDGGRCTFVSECGKRCDATTRLEFDHIDPVARGGQASVNTMRLRCRAHNQYEAERVFGAEFMHEKREQARRRKEQARPAARSPIAEESKSELDVRPWLRQLGFSAEEARRGATLCADIPDAPLEQRVSVVLRGLAPNCVRRAAPMMSAPA